jgi:Papain-like cysteine protease AvrRpt2
MAHFFRFNPPVVSQGDETICWASALASWLKCCAWAGKPISGTWSDGNVWDRRQLSTQQILDSFADDLGDDHSLTGDNIIVVSMRCGINYERRPGDSLSYDYLVGTLKLRGHLYMTYFSYHMRHAVVVYGMSETDGVWCMDPNPDRGLSNRPLSFWSEETRMREAVTIGWAQL